MLALCILALPAATQAPAVAQTPAVLDARLSPDGVRVAFRVADGAATRLYVRRVGESLADDAQVAVPGTTVDAYTWTPDARRLIVRAGDRLFAVSADPGDVGATSVEIARGLTGPSRLAGFAPGGAALIEVPGAHPDRPDLHRADLATGATTTVVSNDGTVTEWLVDAAGTVRGAVRAGEEGRVELVRARAGQMVPVYTCEAGEVCTSLGFHPDGRWWLLTDRDRTRRALVLLDPLTRDEETVRADLSDDPRAAFRSDSLYARDVARLRSEVGADASLAFHPPRANGARMLVTLGDAAGTRLVVFDRWSGAVTDLVPLAGERRAAAAEPALAPDPARLQPVRLRYRVSDNDAGSPVVDVRRRIERRADRGRDTWRVIDLAEVPAYATFTLDTMTLIADPDGGPELGGFDEPPEPEGTEEAADTTIVDGETLRPIARRAGGPVRVHFDFSETGVRGEVESGGFTTDVSMDTRGTVWADGTALQLLVAALPLADGYTARFAVFETDGLDTTTVRLAVIGAERVTTVAGAFDAWRVTINPFTGDAARYEWLVMRDAPHYLLRGSARVNDFVTTTELTDAGGLQ